MSFGTRVIWHACHLGSMSFLHSHHLPRVSLGKRVIWTFATWHDCHFARLQFGTHVIWHAFYLRRVPRGTNFIWHLCSFVSLSFGTHVISHTFDTHLAGVPNHMVLIGCLRSEQRRIIQVSLTAVRISKRKWQREETQISTATETCFLTICLT